MNKLLKKLFALICSWTIITSISTNVFALSNEIDPYKTIIDSINEEYDLQLSYSSVDPTKITPEEFEVLTRDLAVQQRQLLDYISFRENAALLGDFRSSNSITPYALYTVTKTKRDFNNNYVDITLTYTYNSTNNQCIDPRNGKAEVSDAGILIDMSLIVLSKNYVSLDTGRTISAKFNVDITYHRQGVTYRNVLVYAEFSGR